MPQEHINPATEKLSTQKEIVDDILLVKKIEFPHEQVVQVTCTISDSQRDLLKKLHVVFCTLEVCRQQYPSLFRQYCLQICKADENELTQSYGKDPYSGYFLYVPKHVTVEDTINITTIISGQQTKNHLLIIAEPFSTISILQELVADQETQQVQQGLTTELIEINVAEHAHVTYANIQSLPNTLVRASMRRAIVQKTGTMQFMAGDFGARTTRLLVEAILFGEAATANNYSIFFGKDKQEFQLYMRTIHEAKKTFSDMFTRGALSGAAISSYKGLAHIKQKAAGSRAMQRTKTMLLSGQAIANAIPSLQIDNFDVRASHEASVGQLDKEKLFYIMSRGLDEQQARSLFVTVFYAELLRNIKNKVIHQKLLETLQQSLGSELITEADV